MTFSIIARRSAFSADKKCKITKCFGSVKETTIESDVKLRNKWNQENQRKFIEQASKELNINAMEDWYKVTKADIFEVGGGTLLTHYYKTSPYLLVSSLYPEYEWLPWKFDKCPTHFWDNLQNQKKFLDWASKQLNITKMSDWYHITQKEFNAIGGSQLLQHKYNGSIPAMVTSIYPEYDWLPWNFVNTPKNFWHDNKNKIKLVEWLEQKLTIKDVLDWNRISTKDIYNLGAPASIDISRFLSVVYPNHDWTRFEKSPHSRKSQYLLKMLLKNMFPQEEVLEEYRHPDLVNASGVSLELDFYIPKLKIAVEYQGTQHFRNVDIFHNTTTFESGKERDLKKFEMCKEKGISLIEVPYWWDRSYNSLAATFYIHRPDLFSIPVYGTPIPSSPPQIKRNLTNPMKKVLMTATEWKYEEMQPNGWWMTEKYDGIRLYWNGNEFFSRQGNKIKVPEFISSKMPKIALDGELWTQYGLYHDAVSLIRSDNEERWKKAVFWVFDAPEFQTLAFEERMQELRKETLPSFVHIVETIKCENKEHLKQFLNSVVAKGGEGVVLREPRSLYKAGRSESLRKYKEYLDTEVKVLENNYPHGLECLQANEKQIFVAIGDNFEDAKKLKKGAVITVKYLGTNVHGTLQYPKFYRERREDLEWKNKS